MARPSARGPWDKSLRSGAQGNDELALGNKGDDVLLGIDGDDRLIGFGGNDWLVGEAGDDVLMGGARRRHFRRRRRQ